MEDKWVRETNVSADPNATYGGQHQAAVWPTCAMTIGDRAMRRWNVIVTIAGSYGLFFCGSSLLTVDC